MLITWPSKWLSASILHLGQCTTAITMVYSQPS